MKVVRRERAVLLAHRLPERMDESLKAFASRMTLAISELPEPPGSFAIFDLRWSIHHGHVYAHSGDVVVLDDGVRVLSESEFSQQYEMAEEAV